MRIFGSSGTEAVTKADFYRGKAVRRVLWYLHDPDLPETLHWARARVFDDGTADSTFSIEGVAYGFEDEISARHILSEDEYVCFSLFDEDDERETGVLRAATSVPDWQDPPEKPFEYLRTY